ncbi:MAG: ribonuclease E/G, partial [Pseudanabaena sp. LacPavin_0818_WC45_MAG_42_6]|nr:ribonuclease E/G [Pseudanabaena sp. LacPavin_0818_WC45_MAG_42_6]
GLGHLMHLPGEAAGQPVDATSRTWESKQSNQLDFTSEYEDGDSDLGGGLEPNLVNHPSYQERGNLRRRGKRAMLNKDSRESREPEKVAPMDVRSRFEPRIEPLIEPRFEPRIEREIVTDRSVPAKLSLPSIASNIPATKAIAEPSEELLEVVDTVPVVTTENLPERPSKREIRTKVIEPPELIVVEMTEEEQDVYSLIGVSPLVLLDREVKDPRNVIVTVALPGQAPKIANNMGNLRSNSNNESSAESSFDANAETNDSNNMGNLRSSTESNNEPSVESFDSNVETNNLVDRDDEFEERFVEPEIVESPPEVVTSIPVISPVKTNGTSNGVILRVNRPQSLESSDTDENSDLRSESSDASKEFVPIQSPEASRRKRSSASQL